jgi:hypothetical protein
MIKSLIKGFKINVTIGPGLMSTGWYAGQWVKYVGDLTVEKADPHAFCGFLNSGYKLIDFDEKPYHHPDMDGLTVAVPQQYENNPSRIGKVTMVTHEGLYDFNRNVYENDIFQYNQKLYVSVNGLLTNVNLGGNSSPAAFVAGLPSDNYGWMKVQIQM